MKQRSGQTDFLMYMILGLIAITIVTAILLTQIAPALSTSTGLGSDKRNFKDLVSMTRGVCSNAVADDPVTQDMVLELSQTKVLKTETPQSGDVEGQLAIKLSNDEWRKAKIKKCDVEINEVGGDNEIANGKWDVEASCEGSPDSCSGNPKIVLEAEER